MYLTLVIHLRCSLILQLNALMVFFTLLLFDFEKLIYYYPNCQCHCLYQPQVYPQCKSIFNFFVLTQILLCFPIQFLEDCIFWDYLSSLNLEAVFHCNWGPNIIMAQFIHHVKLGLEPL